MVYWSYGDLCGFDPLGVHLSFPNLLDDHHIVQDGAGRHARKPGPMVGFHTPVVGLAVAWAFTRYNRRGIDGSRGIPQAVLEFHGNRLKRLDAGGRAWQHGGLWARVLAMFQSGVGIRAVLLP